MTVSTADGIVTVTGPKGTLNYEYYPTVHIAVEDNAVQCTVNSSDDFKFWGLVRSLVNNMVIGVST